MEPYLTSPSLIKFRGFVTSPGKSLHPALHRLLDQMTKSFKQPIDISPLFAKKDTLVRLFTSFNREFNTVPNSKFESDLKNMDFAFGSELKIRNDRISISMIMNSDESSKMLASVLVHAISTFCHLFPHDYDGMSISICLDNNRRDLDIPNNITTFNKKIEWLRKNSLAFNVSGVTNAIRRTILLTRSEEIVKLLFHEMVHFIGLDRLLMNATSDIKLCNKGQLNLSEAYAETMSIVLNCAYQTIHLGSLTNMNTYKFFSELLQLEKEYSIRLSCTILSFYDYSSKTFQNFYSGNGKKLWSPIPIWEYVVLRTALMFHLDELLDLVEKSHFLITDQNIRGVIRLMKTDDHLLKQLSVCFEKLDPLTNISYSLVHLNWDLF